MKETKETAVYQTSVVSERRRHRAFLAARSAREQLRQPGLSSHAGHTHVGVILALVALLGIEFGLFAALLAALLLAAAVAVGERCAEAGHVAEAAHRRRWCCGAGGCEAVGLRACGRELLSRERARDKSDDVRSVWGELQDDMIGGGIEYVKMFWNHDFFRGIQVVLDFITSRLRTSTTLDDDAFCSTSR